MKIRNGFVSNSSSSSFIVAFKTKPQSVAELKELLFGNLEIFPKKPTYEEFIAESLARNNRIIEKYKDDENFEEIKKEFNWDTPTQEDYEEHDDHKDFYQESTQKIAETVFGDLVNQTNQTIDKIEREARSGSEITGGSSEKYPDPDWEDKDWSKKRKAKALSVAKDFVEQNPNALFFIFEYADDEPYGSLLEYSGVFDSLPHLQIGKH